MKHSPAFLKLVNAAKKRVREVPVARVKRMLRSTPGFVLIDVREDHEWEAGHVQGALHLGKGIIERDIENIVPDRSTEVVLYCGGGFRSAIAAENLLKMGYRDVRSMKGGWREWKRSRGKIMRGRT